jgi:hypothetical protein
MTIPVLPSELDVSSALLATRSIFHVRAFDQTLTALNGQVPTFSRAATASIVDVNGVSFTAAQHMVGWEPQDWDNDSVRECMCARIGTSDRLSYAADWRPIGFGFLLEFIQVGSMPSTGVALWSITNDAVTGSRVVVDSSGSSGFWQLTHHNGSSSVTRTLAVAPASGNRVALWGYVYPDGSVQLWQSINHAAATNTTQSGTAARAASWGTGARLRIGASGTGNYGALILRRLKLVPMSAPDYATLYRTL